MSLEFLGLNCIYYELFLYEIEPRTKQTVFCAILAQSGTIGAVGGTFFCELLLPLGFFQRVPKFFLVFTVFRFPWLSSSFPDFSEVFLRFSSGSSQVFPTWLTPRVLVPKGKPVIRKQLCSARKFILLNLGRNLGSRHFLVAVGILFCMIGFGRIVIDHLYSYCDGSRRLSLLHQVGSLFFLSPFLVSFNSFK